ncbi:MAG: replication initiator protein [Microvirus sp.]|nr:MAG: replication initiator protein [Microvirus sp.]
MPCYDPMKAWQSHNGKIVIFKKNDQAGGRTARLGRDHKRDLELPCGKCIGCRIEKTRQWAQRCTHEAALHDENCFLTLTINTKLPSRIRGSKNNGAASKPLRTAVINPAEHRGGDAAHEQRQLDASPQKGANSVDKKIHQKFLKRLRKNVAVPIRYYMCGEYGKNLTNPHYHYLIFGYNFRDRKYIKKSESGAKLYQSDTLDKLWGQGLAWIGDVTPESAQYVAGYVQKKITGPKAKTHYKGLTPEFGLMSRNPGLGAAWIDKYRTEVYPSDKIYTLDRAAKPPRYYDERMKKTDPTAYEAIKTNRREEAAKNTDNTPERLHARETVTKAKFNTKRRQLETQ